MISGHTWMSVVIFMVMSTIFSGCGGSSSGDASSAPTDKNIQVQTSKESTRILTYINQGNFVDVASLAYKKVTDSTFEQYSMDVRLPGSDESEIATPSTYDVTAVSVDDRLKKIIVQNYQNSLEVKIVDGDRVNILFKDKEFIADEVMSFDDFVAL